MQNLVTVCFSCRKIGNEVVKQLSKFLGNSQQPIATQKVVATVKSIERMIEKNEGESTVFENIIKEARKQDTSIKKYLLAHFLCFSISCSILWKNIIVNLRYNDNDQESSNSNVSDLNSVYNEYVWSLGMTFFEDCHRTTRSTRCQGQTSCRRRIPDRYRCTGRSP